MEQKMLLPIVVIVLVGGFVIGYYAATLGGAGKSAGSTSGAALPLPTQDIVSKALYPEFFQAQTFTQFLKGQLVSTAGDSVVISQGGKNLAIPKAQVTNYYVSTATSRATVDAALLKAGEAVNIAFTFDTETGKATSLAVTAAR